MGKNDGFSSILVMGILILLASLLTSIVFLMQTSRPLLSKTITQLDISTENQRIVNQIRQALKEDPTPESDSPFDPVWEKLAALNADLNSDEIVISLEDISSRININTIRYQQIEQTALSTSLPGISYQVFNDFRHDNGFTLDLSDYSEMIPEEFLEKYFTVWGYFNVNITYEQSLEDIFRLNTGDDFGAENFRSMLQDYLLKGELMTAEELQSNLASAPGLQPLLTTRPVYNIHFLPPVILRALLSYPYGEDPFPNYSLLSDQLTSLCRAREILPEDLRDFIVVEGQQERIFSYLGTTTWFWKITIERDEKTFSYILARIPGEEADSFCEVYRKELYISS